MRILVIEDDPETSRIITRLLTSRGHEVVAAVTAIEAEDLAAKIPFDIMLCDLILPDGNGFSLAQVARQRGIPAIALTGLTCDDDTTLMAQFGFAAYLVKPVAFDELERTISRVIKEYTPTLPSEDSSHPELMPP